MAFGDIIDKILILFLFLTLPLGIYLASKADYSLKNSEDQKTEKIENQPQDNPNSEKIKIINALYIEEDNQLIVSGKAPVANLNVMVSAVITKEIKKSSQEKVSTKSAEPKNSTASAQSKNDSVLGETIQIQAVKTNQEGEFNYRLDVKDNMKLIEIRFEQLDATSTIQYDLEEKKRTL